MNKQQPTPILVLYANLDNCTEHEKTHKLYELVQTMEDYKQCGWEPCVIVTSEPTRLEAVSVTNIDPIEFNEFKKEVLNKINGHKTIKTN